MEPLSVYPFSFNLEDKVSVKDFYGFPNVPRSRLMSTIKENDAVWHYPCTNLNMVKSKMATLSPSSETQKLMNLPADA
ncbi:MAG: hypothetical protein V8R91_20355 [Butyricimonas faecihominis]